MELRLLFQDPWLWSMLVGFICLVADIAAREEKLQPLTLILIEGLASLPVLFITVGVALFTENTGRDYAIKFICFLFVEILCLILYRRYHPSIPQRKSVAAIFVGVVSTVVFLGFWWYRPQEPHFTLISPKSVQQKRDKVTLKIDPQPTSEQEMRMFTKTEADHKWWPCEKMQQQVPSSWSASCGFGTGDAGNGAAFNVGVLYGKKGDLKVDKDDLIFFTESHWNLLKQKWESEEIKCTAEPGCK